MRNEAQVRGFRGVAGEQPPAARVGHAHYIVMSRKDIEGLADQSARLDFEYYRQAFAALAALPSLAPAPVRR